MGKLWEPHGNTCGAAQPATTHLLQYRASTHPAHLLSTREASCWPAMLVQPGLQQVQADTATSRKIPFCSYASLPEAAALQAAVRAGSSWLQTCSQACLVPNLATQGPPGNTGFLPTRTLKTGTSSSRGEKAVSSPA